MSSETIRLVSKSSKISPQKAKSFGLWQRDKTFKHIKSRSVVIVYDEIVKYSRAKASEGISSSLSKPLVYYSRV